MTITGLTLGSIALLSEEELRDIRFDAKDLVVGLSSAGVLYGIFVVGDKLARVIMPRGGEEIASIYDLGTMGQKDRTRRTIGAGDRSRRRTILAWVWSKSA